VAAQPGPQRRIRIMQGARGSSRRWVAQQCPMTRQTDCSPTPARAAGDERLPAGVPAPRCSIRDSARAIFSNSASAKTRSSAGFSRSRSMSRLPSSGQTGLQPAPLDIPKVLVAQARSDELQHDHVWFCGDRAPRSGRRSNRSINAGGRFVELGMNSRYRGVNTRCPGMNS